MRSLRSAVSSVLLFTIGCYQYVPARIDGGLAVGQDIRVVVTDVEAERLRLIEVFPASPTTVRGEVVAIDGNAVDLRIPIRAEPRAFRQEVMFQEVAIRREGIERVDLRRLNKVLTAVSIAAGGSIILSVLVAAFSGKTGGVLSPDAPTDKD